jgi:hypothetical protein
MYYCDILSFCSDAKRRNVTQERKTRFFISMPLALNELLVKQLCCAPFFILHNAK